MKVGDLFKVGLVIGFIFGFVGHLDSDKFIIYDQLTELIIFLSLSLFSFLMNTIRLLQQG